MHSHAIKGNFLRNVVIVDVVNIRVLGETKRRLLDKTEGESKSAVCARLLSCRVWMRGYSLLEDGDRLLHKVFQNKYSNNDNNGPSYSLYVRLRTGLAVTFPR